MGYLLISRKINERIMIGDDIEILISDVKTDKQNPTVEVAIAAPKDCKIMRRATHMEEQKNYGSHIRNKSR